MIMPMIQANPEKLTHNAKTILAACKQQGVKLAAVTKMFGGDPDLAKVLVDAGVDMLADARVRNLARLPQTLPRLSLRIADPMLAEWLVSHCEYSLQSSPQTIIALGRAAKALDKQHHIILMVDLGDLREGIFYKEEAHILEVAALVLQQPGLILSGVGTNLTCFGGILPEETNMGKLLEIASLIRTTYDIPLPIVSGGNSSSLHLLFEGRLPPGINHLRVGEGLLLGMDTAVGKPFKQLYQDAFTQFARLVEIYRKPSLPEGKPGPNAFGETVSFVDKGPMLRGILAIGRQDTDQDSLMPHDKRVKVLGASSDHLMVDLTQATCYQVGDVLAFTPGYSALLRAYTSPYVEKTIL